MCVRVELRFGLKVRGDSLALAVVIDAGWVHEDRPDPKQLCRALDAGLDGAHGEHDVLPRNSTRPSGSGLTWV